MTQSFLFRTSGIGAGALIVLLAGAPPAAAVEDLEVQAACGDALQAAYGAENINYASIQREGGRFTVYGSADIGSEAGKQVRCRVFDGNAWQVAVLVPDPQWSSGWRWDAMETAGLTPAQPADPEAPADGDTAATDDAPAADDAAQTDGDAAQTDGDTASTDGATDGASDGEEATISVRPSTKEAGAGLPTVAERSDTSGAQAEVRSRFKSAPGAATESQPRGLPNARTAEDSPFQKPKN